MYEFRKSDGTLLIFTIYVNSLTTLIHSFQGIVTLYVIVSVSMQESVAVTLTRILIANLKTCSLE